MSVIRIVVFPLHKDNAPKIIVDYLCRNIIRMLFSCIGEMEFIAMGELTTFFRVRN